MNSSPTALRFSSGSETPSRRARNRSCAWTWTSGTWKCPSKVSTTCAASSLRRNPWSTKTQTSWSPTALCTSSAATAESTPPGERAEDAVVTDLRADPLDLLLDHGRRRPGRRRVGHGVEEVLQQLLPVRRVHDLRMELDAVEPPVRVLEGRDRRVGRLGRDPRAGRSGGHRVAVAHPAGLLRW